MSEVESIVVAVALFSCVFIIILLLVALKTIDGWVKPLET